MIGRLISAVVGNPTPPPPPPAPRITPTKLPKRKHVQFSKLLNHKRMKPIGTRGILDSDDDDDTESKHNPVQRPFVQNEDPDDDIVISESARQDGEVEVDEDLQSLPSVVMNAPIRDYDDAVSVYSRAPNQVRRGSEANIKEKRWVHQLIKFHEMLSASIGLDFGVVCDIEFIHDTWKEVTSLTDSRFDKWVLNTSRQNYVMERAWAIAFQQNRKYEHYIDILLDNSAMSLFVEMCSIVYGDTRINAFQKMPKRAILVQAQGRSASIIAQFRDYTPIMEVSPYVDAEESNPRLEGKGDRKVRPDNGYKNEALDTPAIYAKPQYHIFMWQALGHLNEFRVIDSKAEERRKTIREARDVLYTGKVTEQEDRRKIPLGREVGDGKTNMVQNRVLEEIAPLPGTDAHLAEVRAVRTYAPYEDVVKKKQQAKEDARNEHETAQAELARLQGLLTEIKVKRRDQDSKDLEDEEDALKDQDKIAFDTAFAALSRYDKAQEELKESEIKQQEVVYSTRQEAKAKAAAKERIVRTQHDARDEHETRLSTLNKKESSYLSAQESCLLWFRQNTDDNITLDSVIGDRLQRILFVELVALTHITHQQHVSSRFGQNHVLKRITNTREALLFSISEIYNAGGIVSLYTHSRQY